MGAHAERYECFPNQLRLPSIAHIIEPREHDLTDLYDQMVILLTSIITSQLPTHRLKRGRQ
jgi:hypothetical protein